MLTERALARLANEAYVVEQRLRALSEGHIQPTEIPDVVALAERAELIAGVLRGAVAAQKLERLANPKSGKISRRRG